ncbi:unnamed protein product [Lupinus luteus]|uniref:Uncharacterized protein n=1 Tax=Lupinus luteus TaxID=3873 RepID=A0AAV1XT92_LUPLU
MDQTSLSYVHEAVGQPVSKFSNPALSAVVPLVVQHGPLVAAPSAASVSCVAALEVWKLGEKIGLLGNDNEDEIIQKLIAVEDRDNAKFEDARRRSNGFDDINLH